MSVAGVGSGRVASVVGGYFGEDRQGEAAVEGDRVVGEVANRKGLQVPEHVHAGTRRN
jgi:hypothetical protein